ncbi:TRAP transporter small permease subunit [Rhodospira trueperi]|uniref:TRAP transporter small permease protein n=1 Tax=Rhodospira trueperi TaxID=69960 RepID=A0A1G7F2F9_9PROT|nr:TRAP transporter small permease subunit [Rhodospira trueperi]SDE70108.1 TRAP-type mannitol/chloroaromatic compound transport system, small permease component [Rhodospira trueperi]
MSFLHALARWIDRINTAVGQATAWLALIMVLVQFLVVVLRYVFGLGFIWMQESITYMHGLLFMVGAGYTLLQDGHVRVDVFYREVSPRRKALVNLLGSVLFLIPFCTLILWVSWDYVMNSWRVLEGSKETSGIQGIYLLKTVILVFGGLVILQGLSVVARSILTLAGWDGAEADDDKGGVPAEVGR